MGNCCGKRKPTLGSLDGNSRSRTMFTSAVAPPLVIANPMSPRHRTQSYTPSHTRRTHTGYQLEQSTPDHPAVYSTSAVNL